MTHTGLHDPDALSKPPIRPSFRDMQRQAARNAYWNQVERLDKTDTDILNRDVPRLDETESRAADPELWEWIDGNINEKGYLNA